MNNYDFSRLNDKEFEALSIDLLSKVEGLRIERFKAGKDKGVDGRFFSPNNGEVIIQCKHWLKSGVKKLIYELKENELKKIKSLSPKRYILTTSLNLSRVNKQAISKIVTPYLSEQDIFGKEDLEDLISQNSDIEQKHYKLWLASSSVLISLLNNAVVGRSSDKLDEIKQLSSKYVATSNYSKAIEKLENTRCLIITGDPGIGKTTLAYQACLHYFRNKYEIYFLSKSVSEAESLYKKGVEQLFYFDDFLGRNYLEALDRHEDSEIVNFIKRITSDNSKRFILTSRTIILNRGKSLSELLRTNNINRNEYEIELNSLTAIDKAQILYNHIWFSDLSETHIEKIYEERRYKKIINHRNYNPRLISFITDSYKMSCIDPIKYWDHVHSILENPREVWSHLFDNQIDDAVKRLVYLTVLNGKEISEGELKESFISITTQENTSSSSNIEKDFRISIEIAVKALLRRKLNNITQKITYDLFNPSIADFVIRRICKEYLSLESHFKHLNTIQSLLSLEKLGKAQVISKIIFDKVLINLTIEKLSVDDISDEYKIKLAHLASDWLSGNESVNFALNRFLDLFIISDDFSNFITEVCELYVWHIIVNTKSDSFIKLFEYVRSILDLDYTLDRNEYASLHKLIEKIASRLHDVGYPKYESDKKADFEIADEFKQEIKKRLIAHWIEAIQEEVAGSDLLEEYDDRYNNMYHDKEYIFEKIQDYISDELDLLGADIFFSEDEILAIAEACNIDLIISMNDEIHQQEDRRYDVYKEQRDYGKESISEDDLIDDLFDKEVKR
ncbi:MAG: hypothetical protein ACJAS6_001312 [Rickettsiales bacterium]|jgi:hypothetical protein